MRLQELTAAEAAVYWPLRLRALKEEPEAFGASYEEVQHRVLDDVAERMRATSSEGGFTLGAYDGETLVGMVTLGRTTLHKQRHIGSVFGVYVAPEARGSGVGRALLEALIARARQAGDIEQLILTVESGNQKAITLYRSLGFTRYGSHPHALRFADGTFLDEDLMHVTLA